jgi:hippurate hydrolase
MIEDGLFKRFPCDSALRAPQFPGEPEGQIMVRPGPITAAVDIVGITIQGVGGHGAIPHKSVDPIVAASSLVMAIADDRVAQSRSA